MIPLTARLGAIAFALWGLLHIAGGGAILAALAESPASGFAVYLGAAQAYDPLAGQILAYLAFVLCASGIAVVGVAILLNWRNSALGLAINTGIAGVLDLGLIVFLALPGFVTWPEASLGIGLLVAGAVLAGIGCRVPNGVSAASVTTAARR